MSDQATTRTGIPLARLMRCTRKSLEGGAIVRLGNDEQPIVLCHRTAGQTISDDASGSDFEALRSGVFKRYRSVTYDRGVEVASDFVWMFLCPLDEDAMAAALGPDFDALPWVDREFLPFQTALVAMANEKAAARDARRELRHASAG